MDKTLLETIYVYISLWLFRRLPFLLFRIAPTVLQEDWKAKKGSRVL